MRGVLVIGSGITGCTAALELARQGYSVDVVESASRVGGKILAYCCKATDECSRCGVCVAHTRVAEAIRTRGIRFLTATTIQDVSRPGKTVAVQADQRHPVIQLSKCTACDACAKACPAKCISRYDRGGLIQYAIDHAKCVRRSGRTCNKCIRACREAAVSGEGESGSVSIHADAVLVATGHQAFDARGKPGLGYSRLKNVLTAEEAELILSRQTCLRAPADDVAFVQCVGSRDPLIGRNYCSAVCCSYAVRMARILRRRHPQGKMTVYTIDLQNFDKTFSCVRHQLTAEGVQLLRGVPSSIDPTAGGRLLVKREGVAGAAATSEHDVVVLSVGMGPAAGAAEIAGWFGLRRDEFGFFEPVIANTFVAGTCTEPQSILDCIASAEATSAEIMNRLADPGRPPRETHTANREIRRVELSQGVLVLGGGMAGAHVAAELKGLGYQPVVVEQSAHTGGAQANLSASDTGCGNLLAGVNVLTSARIEKLTGHVGSFRAAVTGAGAAGDIDCGAVVVCTGSHLQDVGKDLFDFDRILPACDLPAAVARLPLKDRPDAVAFVLDMKVDETKASTALAFRAALQLRREYLCEVYVFLREVRVSAKGLEKLYGEAREAGVNIVKYDGTIRINTVEDGVEISARDPLLGRDVGISCQMVGISRWGLQSAADARLAALLGINLDCLGQMQDNNAHLFPELSNRPGIFLAGACRGRYYPPDVLADARAAALRVHSLLSRKHLDVELSNATVDENKCALCLTCVRTCPHGAMEIDDKEQKTVSRPEACQKCGICAGECPAGAIEMPASVIE